ncbi:MAG: hypothetical protein H6595_12290 [Flavobacteriales bacterium]|nr:hypothetical protein [Flavobacteriales bacterium]MCB9168242.1 hypothetical protein [Flavobacteriales bacterium]
MIAYALLGFATVVIVLWTLRIVRRTGDRTFLLGMVLFYIWTFMGAWFFIGDAMSGYQGFRVGLNYYYLMQKMFPFELDRDYLIALGGYTAFTFLMLLIIDLVTRSIRSIEPSARMPIAVDHRVLHGIAILAGIVSFFLVLPLIKEALATDRPIYLVTRGTTYPGSTLHGLFNEVAAMAVLLGWAIRSTARDGRWFTDRGQRWPGWTYPALLLVVSLYFMVLGNRHELFMALVLGSMVFALNARGRRPGRYVIYASVVVAQLFITAKVREMTWKEVRGEEAIVEDDTPFGLPLIAHVPRKVTSPLARAGRKVISNELFCAHFSMYGVRRERVRPEPLLSMRYLFSSLVPRAIRSDRPPSSYDLYAKEAHLTPGQGYTIHPAAGFYLNGGWYALFFGGALWGLLWGGLIRLRSKPAQRPLPIRLFMLMGTSCWVAYLPILLRDGPELFKGLVFEGILMPVGMVLVAAWSARSKAQNVPE